MNPFRRGDRVRVIDDLGNPDLWLYARREVGKVECVHLITGGVYVRWLWEEDGKKFDWSCWLEPGQLEKAV